MTTENTPALESQVGGTHYADLTYQPIFVCEAATAVGGFCVGNMFKYLCRYPFKGKYREDLEKAKHYVQIYKDIGLHNPSRETANDIRSLLRNVEQFCTKNNLTFKQRELLFIVTWCVTTVNIPRIVEAIDEVLNADDTHE